MPQNADLTDRSSTGANGHPSHWAAIAGLWDFDGGTATYRGPGSGDSGDPYGIALTDRGLTDGSLGVRISFSEMSSVESGYVSAGVVLGFQSERSRYIVVQLGRYKRAYSIAEFIPGFGWQPVENSGSAQNLEPNQEYRMEVRQTGQEIRMIVNSVPVIERILQQPLNGRRVGLFAWGKSPISFKDLTVASAKPQMFVAMQFGQPFDVLYKDVIKDLGEKMDLDVCRIDEVAGPGIVFEDIKRHIAESKIVLAEITAPNQNVFYELGYAHALNKPTILLAQRGKELPFDIGSYRVIFYDDSIGGSRPSNAA